MAKRVFISFHMDDMHAKELLVQQAKRDQFDLEFINYAVNEPFDERWKTQCEERIDQTSVTICLIGEKTYQREAVIWELNTSYDLGKKVIGVRIHKGENDTIPWPIREHNSPVINWNLKSIARELEEE